MFKNPVNLEMLSESKVKAILERDESAAKKAGNAAESQRLMQEAEDKLKRAGAYPPKNPGGKTWENDPVGNR